MYLEKHQHEIINYKRRNGAGKTIGSGRVEKAVDLTIGQRQKNKGMSWSRLGSSRALSLLKVAERGRSVAAVVVPRSGCLINE